MAEVTCFKCNSVVQIVPGNERCSVCGEDLKRLMTPEAATNYFYSRAARLAEQGEDEAALAETERGIQYSATSDLRLLAAILAQRLSRFDRMRHHVSAIPVDDPLRSEGEWLVRSHQNRQRELREGSRRRSIRSRHVAADETLPEESPLPSGGTALTNGGGRLLGLASVLAALVIVVGAGWLLLRTDPSLVTDLIAALQEPFQPGQEPIADATPPSTTSSEVAPATPTALPAVTLPTPTVSPDLAQQPSPIVDSAPGAGTSLSPGEFDLADFLSQAGYSGLALLPVEASLKDGKLVLSGILGMELQRIQLLEAVQSATGVTEVVGTDLLVRRPATYVVQEGDTLWGIVYALYGNVDSLQDFVDYNADVLPSIDWPLSVGMELKVPPDE